MRRKQAVAALGLALAFAGPLGTRAAAAQGQPDVVVTVTAMKEVVERDAAGRQTVRLEDAEATGPGDTLVYRIVYTNRGNAPARDPKVIDPIPAGTLLVPGSWQTEGADFSVSVDGGRTFQAYPARRAARQTDGTTVLKDVALSDYTHVRWTTTEPLQPGATRSAQFKVTVR